MKKFSNALARRYGTALYRAVLNEMENSKLDVSSVLDQVQILSGYLKKETVGFFVMPSMSLDVKKSLLKDFLSCVFKVSEPLSVLSAFLNVVLENGRFVDIVLMLEFFLAQMDDHLGIVRGQIRSAALLSEADLDAFAASFSSLVRQKVVFESHVDASLKSGYIINVGHLSVDASLSSRLSKLKESLI